MCRSAQGNYIRLSQDVKLQRGMVEKPVHTAIPRTTRGLRGVSTARYTRPLCANRVWEKQDYVNADGYGLLPAPTIYNTVYTLNIYKVLVQLMLPFTRRVVSNLQPREIFPP
jgi:hypothetical protein